MRVKNRALALCWAAAIGWIPLPALAADCSSAVAQKIYSDLAGRKAVTRNTIATYRPEDRQPDSLPAPVRLSQLTNQEVTAFLNRELRSDDGALRYSASHQAVIEKLHAAAQAFQRDPKFISYQLLLRAANQVYSNASFQLRSLAKGRPERWDLHAVAGFRLEAWLLESVEKTVSDRCS